MSRRPETTNENYIDASLAYKLAAGGIRAITRFPGLSITSSGTENLHQPDPYLLAYTHHNSWDTPAIGSVVYEETGRPIHFMAKEELLHIPIVNKALKSMHATPINREKPSHGQIRTAISLLKSGNLLGIAPEGGRINGNTVVKLEGGTGYIAIRASVLIVPVAVAGRNWRIQDKSLPFLPRTMHVHIGEPLDVRGLSARNDEKMINEELLRPSLQTLLAEAYFQYENRFGSQAAARLDRPTSS